MPTDPLAETIEYLIAAWPASAQVQVDLGALSHPGKVRANNEDCYLVARFTRALQPLLTNLPGGQLAAGSRRSPTACWWPTAWAARPPGRSPAAWPSAR